MVAILLLIQVVDTGQDRCYDERGEIEKPAKDRPFCGQDAQHDGARASYRDNGDGTVTDLVTSLVWQKAVGEKRSYAEALEGAAKFRLAGKEDWRLPSIKELYSLMDFRGSLRESRPYLDSKVFDFRFGDESKGERRIDAQYWSSTEYVGGTMGGQPTVFGVNFADGRIKGYPRRELRAFVRYVRGRAYGVNSFVDNGDGTVTDRATGLMWQKEDSGSAMSWKEALAYAAGLRLAGRSDWRVPNAKELQSLVDYTRAPDARDPSKRSAAIDPIFRVAAMESWYWTGTTHLDGPPPSAAVYVAFGQAFGFMHRRRDNVHGAGAQRSDPKSGDPADFPFGKGPQGDEIRVRNFVRCVRDAK